jgi:hypothetical protein
VKTTLGLQLCFVVGDQQSYSRMIFLKRKEPDFLDWVIPLPDDFHFIVHALMAIHQLWWFALVRWVVMDVGVCMKTCGAGEKPEKWSSVEKYNNYRFLYELLIVSLMTYLKEAVPAGLLGNYAVLSGLAAQNKGATIILRFLYEFGLPWLSLRQSIRGRRSDNIDTMWRMWLPMFRATGKTLYSSLCVDTTFVSLSMHEPLQKLWREHRTCSLRGNPGRDIAWGQAQEGANDIIKNGLSDGADRASIDPFITIYNGIRDVETKMRDALGVSHDELDEDTVVEEADVKKIVDALKECLPVDEFLSELATNPFGSGAPWDKVRQQEGKTLRTYILEHLNKPNFEMPSQADW